MGLALLTQPAPHPLVYSSCGQCGVATARPTECRAPTCARHQRRVALLVVGVVVVTAAMTAGTGRAARQPPEDINVAVKEDEHERVNG